MDLTRANRVQDCPPYTGAELDAALSSPHSA